MTFLSLLFSLTILRATFGDEVSASHLELSIIPRIINGKDAHPGSWPWHVTLQTPDGILLCGGSLINRNWVMTAARCNVTAADLVVAGLSDRHSPGNDIQVLNIAKIFRHPKFNLKKFRNDIALLKVMTSFKFSRTVFPIALPSAKDRFLAGTRCTIMGWGDTHTEINATPRKLQEATVPLLSKTECKRILGRSYNDAIICAGANGVCSFYGDGGAPLACSVSGLWTLVGIIFSHSSTCPTLYPFLASSVTTSMPWAVKIIANN